jgi:hypothetical protein
MVYDRYNYTFHGGYTPTNISNITFAGPWHGNFGIIHGDRFHTLWDNLVEMGRINWDTLIGWWYTYPSEKSESVGVIIPNISKNNPNVPNHQPVHI